MTASLIYAGIGSRETPVPMLEIMWRVAWLLARQGWLLRSGGAPGADTAFDQGAIAGGGRREIYLPHGGFFSDLRPAGPLTDPSYIVPQNRFSQDLVDRAYHLASEYHPGWIGLVDSHRDLMMRNVFQILGPDLNTPVQMAVCYAKGSVIDARDRVVDVRGGTGQAVRVAADHPVITYNLALPDHLQAIQAFLDRSEPTPTPPHFPKPPPKSRKRAMR